MKLEWDVDSKRKRQQHPDRLPTSFSDLLRAFRKQLPGLRSLVLESYQDIAPVLEASTSWRQLGCMTQLTFLHIESLDDTALKWQDVAQLGRLTQRLGLVASAAQDAEMPNAGLQFPSHLTDLTELLLRAPGLLQLDPLHSFSTCTKLQHFILAHNAYAPASFGVEPCMAVGQLTQLTFLSVPGVDLADTEVATPAFYSALRLLPHLQDASADICPRSSVDAWRAACVCSQDWAAEHQRGLGSRWGFAGTSCRQQKGQQKEQQKEQQQKEQLSSNFLLVGGQAFERVRGCAVCSVALFEVMHAQGQHTAGVHV